MTATLNFDSVPQVRKAASHKPDVGTVWYSHDGDKYPCLYLGVGKRAATWYFKGRLNGRSQQKSLGMKFPEATAAQAKAKIEALTKHLGNEATADIRTVRDAWEHHCTTKQSEGRMSDAHRRDMTNKLNRWASDIMSKSPTDVSTIMIQNAINAIDTGRGDNSSATKRHVKAALSAALIRLPGENLLKHVTVPEANERDPLWYAVCDDDRELDPEDLSVVWEAIMSKREKNVIIGTAWIVMLFTGIRSTNVRTLRWKADGTHGWVDLQRNVFVFPKLKSGNRDMEIPVCETVIRELLSIKSAGSDWVFPSVDGHIDHLDALKANGRVVLRQHDTRKFFQEACNEALLPDHVMAFLRGDKTTKETGKMLLKYTTRVGKSAPAMVETVLFERIKVEPSFED